MVKGGILRFALAVAALLVAVVLAQPGPGRAGQRTWDTLLQPLAIGKPVALGYVLGAPHRGEEQDIVFAARSPDGGSTIEVHVLDRGRWPGIRETASFGVSLGRD